MQGMPPGRYLHARAGGGRCGRVTVYVVVEEVGVRGGVARGVEMSQTMDMNLQSIKVDSG